MLEEFKNKIKALLKEYELEGLSSTKFKSKYEILFSMSESILLIGAESDLINLISSIMKNREYLIHSYNHFLPATLNKHYTRHLHLHRISNRYWEYLPNIPQKVV